MDAYGNILYILLQRDRGSGMVQRRESVRSLHDIDRVACPPFFRHAGAYGIGTAAASGRRL